MIEENLYKKYAVQIQIRDKLLGGKPKTEKVLEGWLKSQGRESTLKVEEEKRAWTGFKRDEKGLYLDSYQIKGMVKEVCKVLGLKQRGLVGLIQSGFFVYPARIHLGKKEPDNFVEEIFQGMGPKDPRSTIKRHDYVEKVKLDFEVRHFDTGVLTEKTLRLIFEAGQEIGLGTNRHEGGEFGRFEVIKLEEIS